MRTADSAIPEGFKLRHLGDGFMDVNGPLYYRRAEGTDRNRSVSLGFRVEMRHCNPMKACHGGMLATFTDMLFAVTAHATCEAGRNRFLPTISLQLDYLAGAPLGSWVQGDAQVLRATRNMVFLQGLLSADSVPIARASGIFKIGPAFSAIPAA
ncbi:MAG: PaaI family thioesterase [Burkholderiaceae bacterium]